VPLGGSRKGPVRTYVNLVVTRLLGGLWHGAGWTYLIWGAIHGVGLAGERAGALKALAVVPRVLRITLIFLVVTAAWVFFRSESLAAATQYLASMVGLVEPSESVRLVRTLAFSRASILALGAAVVIVWWGVDSWRFTQRIGPARAVVLLSLFCVSVVMLSVQSYNPFIYFIF
jgi:alginate O-acetyltransferase complex protein AlgI